MTIDAREVKFRKADESEITPGDSLPNATYWIDLPNEPGPHSLQINYDNALAANAGAVQVSNQSIGKSVDTGATIWSATSYTSGAVVAGTAGSFVVLIPEIHVGRRRFAFTVTTPGVARAFVR